MQKLEESNQKQNKNMIKSILDTDIYKFSMSYAYFKLYPLAEGTFKFNDRNKESWKEHPEILETLKMELYKASDLSLTEEEKNWCIDHIPYIPGSYWEWLSTFKFDPSLINCWLDEEGILQCEVTDKMYKVSLYEILILATWAEIRNSWLKSNGYPFYIDKAKEIITEKIDFANRNQIPFSEFGTRRRYSSAVHEMILDVIKEKSLTCTGTSNVFYAMKYGMKPQGTTAHEFYQMHAALFGYKRANYLALEDWIKVYDGALGTALVDTYTTKSFLRTLTRKQALLLQGFIPDSGDEYKVGNMIISRLKEFGIDPRSKVIVFSNALDFDKAKDIYEYFNGRCIVAFGIGTNLTCDTGIPDFKPANIVMKLSKCRMSPKDPWENCIKISDDFGKHMGDDIEFKIAQYELHL